MARPSSLRRKPGPLTEHPPGADEQRLDTGDAGFFGNREDVYVSLRRMHILLLLDFSQLRNLVAIFGGFFELQLAEAASIRFLK